MHLKIRNLSLDILQYHNDFEILRLMDSIATLTGLSFEMVCRIGVAKMWTKILDDKVAREINLLSASHIATDTSRVLVLRQYLQRKQYYYKDTYQQQLEQEQEEILHRGIFEEENNGNPEEGNDNG